jgi:peroxiredoxin
MWAIVAALFAATATVTAAEPATRPAATQPHIPAVAERAPDFELWALDDKPVRLAELTKSGPVVLVVLRGWVGYQCPVCTKQVGDFIAHAKEFQDAGVQVVLVYPGPGGVGELKKRADEFATGKTLPPHFRLVLDPQLKFTEAWGLRWRAKGETAYPSTFVIDKSGTVRFAKTSRSHGDRASAKQVLAALSQADPDRHPEQKDHR